MRSIHLLTVLGLLLLTAQPSRAAKKHVSAVRDGNLAYQQGDFKEALEDYHIAEADRPETPGVDYNIGNALYELGDYEQATERLTKALNTDDAQLAAQAQYNLGSARYRAGDYQKAIEAFKESLDLNPEDMDAKYNLELARRMLKEQAKTEQQQEQNQDKQEQQKQEEKQQEQQQQDQQDQQDQQQQQQEQNQQEDENQKREQQNQQQQGKEQKEMSREDAERILNALQDDEQDIQKRIRRNKTGTGYVGKDW